jgi:NitT/TauT family transport system substrate-binding protein
MAVQRLVAGCLAGALAIALTTACGGDSGGGDRDPRILRIAHNSNAAALPARVADAEGIFARHNLKAEFTKTENIGNLPGTLGKSFDIALSVPTTLITAANQRIPATEIAGATKDIQQNPTGFLIGSQRSGVTTVKQLQGKTLGVLTETGTVHVATKAWLKAEGVPPESVKIVQVDGPAQADQLASGRIDAVETVMPFATNVLNQPGTVNMGDPYLKLAPELSAIFWIAQQDWAREHPDVVRDFRAALEEAGRFIVTNDARAREVLKQYTELPDPVIAKTTLPTYTSEVRADDLRIWLEAMRAVNGFRGNVDIASLTAQG